METALPSCPVCGEEVPEDSIWQIRGRFYCSQEHAKAHSYTQPASPPVNFQE